MIQFIKGSIFDSKCDLIIIPCNSSGGVSPEIQKELMVNDFPNFNKELSAGGISFVENVGRFTNASMVGYAASVDISSNRSSKKILQEIMYKIKLRCKEQSLNKVNIPLLGTGAGGVSHHTSFDVMKLEFENETGILLCIHAFSDDICYEITNEKALMSGNSIKNPRVFLSYAGNDVSNRNWVRDLACRLRENGVDARIDIFHLKPGQDLPQWMTNELIMADKVLLICDKYYAEKADNRRGGVGWETMIIQGDMLLKQEQNKYISIIRDKNIDQSLPIYVKSKYALNWAEENQIDKEFDDLLLYLFNCDIEPPIGAIPSFVKEKLVK